MLKKYIWKYLYHQCWTIYSDYGNSKSCHLVKTYSVPVYFHKLFSTCPLQTMFSDLSPETWSIQSQTARKQEPRSACTTVCTDTTSLGYFCIFTLERTCSPAILNISKERELLLSKEHVVVAIGRMWEISLGEFWVILCRYCVKFLISKKMEDS